MTSAEMAFTPAWQLRDQILAKQVSPVELTELFLRRIEEFNPRLNAYLTVAGDQALADAREAESAVKPGAELGALHGVPIAIKDLNMTKGLRTTRGSLIYKDAVPDEDEVSIARIRAAGAIILGKTNTPEFGHSATTENLLGDHGRNPWDTDRTSGGSSGGAGAGLAAGLHPLAQGSDGGGSIRIPSSLCGVFGIKPTQGRVPRPYKGPGGWGQFSQNGPMARTVRDVAILLQVMAGPDPGDPIALKETPPDFSAALNKGVKGLRLGWTPDLGSLPVDPEVKRITRESVRAFEEMGATVEEAEMEIDHDEVRDLFMTIWLSDYLASYGELMTTRRSELTPLLAEMLEEAMEWPASRLASALRGLEWHRDRMDTIIRRYDLLLTPTLATAAFPVGRRPSIIDGKEVDTFWGFSPFTFPINMSGHTASSVPCGFTSDGLPVGLHIIGHRGAEAMVLQASAAFEEARPWADRRPPVS